MFAFIRKFTERNLPLFDRLYVCRWRLGLTGNLIQYFVAAQDTVGNFTTNPIGGIGNVNAVTFSGTPNSYTTAAPEVNVKGKGVSIVDGDASPSALDNTDFGSVNLSNAEIYRTFTIENLGTANLNLTGAPKVTLSGANSGDFFITAQPSTIVTSGSSTTFQVRFVPAAAGLRTAILSIANDDSDENPYDFAIQGTGVASPAPVTLTVTQADDAGDGICDQTCTLRDAVAGANASPGDDTINFDPMLSHITLSDELVVEQNGSLVVSGPGANILTIDGGPGTNRIFYDTTDLTISA